MGYTKIITGQFDKVTLDRAAFYRVSPSRVRIAAEKGTGLQLWCLLDGEKVESLTAKKLEGILRPPPYLRALGLSKTVAAHFCRLLSHYGQGQQGKVSLVSHYNGHSSMYLYENGEAVRELPNNELEKILRA